jgi:hypothetical protein
MSPQAGEMLLNQIAPRLQASIVRFRAVIPTGIEDNEELLQDAIALAAELLNRAINAGKTVTPGNIAFYTVQLLKSGRRSTGSSAADVMAPATQMKRRSVLVSIDQPMTFNNNNDDSDESMTLSDMLVSRCEDPATEGLRNVAWEELDRKLTTHQRAVATALAEGNQLN